jgi:hypothetical protein
VRCWRFTFNWSINRRGLLFLRVLRNLILLAPLYGEGSNVRNLFNIVCLPESTRCVSADQNSEILQAGTELAGIVRSSPKSGH